MKPKNVGRMKGSIKKKSDKPKGLEFDDLQEHFIKLHENENKSDYDF